MGGPISIEPQDAIDLCRLDDTIIEEDGCDCPNFSLNEFSETPLETKEYDISNDEVNLDSEIVADLVEDARVMMFDNNVPQDDVVAEFMRRELSEEEAKIIVNKAINKQKTGKNINNKDRGFFAAMFALLAVILGFAIIPLKRAKRK